MRSNGIEEERATKKLPPRPMPAKETRVLSPSKNLIKKEEMKGRKRKAQHGLTWQRMRKKRN